ncbi:MAG TPA: CDP-alcohol phosphatidyltransferase family protein [Spirochaetota bacterium]|nr:CDP-alcohol phosphatidyltransferase family protein [Spirochaetota bacterium]
MANDTTAAARITTITEEPVNTWLNRPLASLFVAFFYRHTSVSANQVTMLAIVFGVAAGILFTTGSYAMLFLGALAYQLSIVLDCADGQLARLKGTSSEFGRILDGISDYIVGLSILGGALYALLTSYGSLSGYMILPVSQDLVLPLAILGFVSITVHSIAYDLIKTKFTSIVKTGVDQTVKEQRDLEARYRREYTSLPAGKRLMLRIYLTYNGLQNSLLSVGAYSRLSYSPSEREAIIERERGFLRLWSFLGPNSHMLFIVLAALAGDLVFALWLAVVPFNVYYIIMLIVTKIRMRAH